MENEEMGDPKEYNMVQITTPISEEIAASLQVGDTVEISGYILCGRDAVLHGISYWR